MFGDTVIKVNKYLRLIIQLVLPGETEQAFARDRAPCGRWSQQILGPRFISPEVVAGRNSQSWSKPVRLHVKMAGYDAAAAFVERHTVAAPDRRGPVAVIRTPGKPVNRNWCW
jgi:serine kinase of HPr protein (carbohydrate metabolism regulator)